MNNDEQIKNRIAGRKSADELMGLIDRSEQPREWQVAFWCEIGMILHEAERALGIVAKPPPPSLVPMNDLEAAQFSMRPMPFGKYHGDMVGQVLENDPTYLDWLVRATEEDNFKQMLRRYIAMPEIQDQLP